MKKKYPIASIFRRALSRLLDFILVLGIIVLLFFVIFSDKFTGIIFESYLFFIFIILVWLIFFIYFIIIPLISNGRTLFIWALNMRIHCIDTPFYFVNHKSIHNKIWYGYKLNIFFSLIKRELFVWNILCMINFILGVVVIVLGDIDGLVFLKSLFLANIGITNIDGFNVYSIIFSSLYSINFLIIFLIFINFLMNSEKRNMIDVFSSTVTIYLKEIDPKNDNINMHKKKKINYGMPLEILDSVFEELDDLRENDDKEDK